MRCKQMLAVPRPSHLAPRLLPCIDVPAHHSFPSGHGGESYLVAALLSRWLARIGDSGGVGAMLHQAAHRIARNRVVAGVHFPVDSIAGRLLGAVVEHHLLALAGAGDSPRAQLPGPGGWGEPEAGVPSDVRSGRGYGAQPWREPLCGWQLVADPLEPAPDLQALWRAACAEWPEAT